MKGQQVKYAVQLSVKMVPVYCSVQSGTVTVTVSNKYYDMLEYIFIVNLE